MATEIATAGFYMGPEDQLEPRPPFVRTRYRIHTAWGAVEVAGYVHPDVPYFGVHYNDYNGEDVPDWTVDHLPTGHMVTWTEFPEDLVQLFEALRSCDPVELASFDPLRAVLGIGRPIVDYIRLSRESDGPLPPFVEWLANQPGGWC